MISLQMPTCLLAQPQPHQTGPLMALEVDRLERTILQPLPGAWRIIPTWHMHGQKK